MTSVQLHFQEEVSKKPVWRDEDDEVEGAVVDVPHHRSKMYLRRVTDAKDQKITIKVLLRNFQLQVAEIFASDMLGRQTSPSKFTRVYLPHILQLICICDSLQPMFF